MCSWAQRKQQLKVTLKGYLLSNKGAMGMLELSPSYVGIHVNRKIDLTSQAHLELTLFGSTGCETACLSSCSLS